MTRLSISRLRVSLQVVVVNVNKELDIPWIPESMEDGIIKSLVDKVLPEVEPSLLTLVPAAYVACIKIALDDQVSLVEKKTHIAALLRAELAEPLSKELNKRVDLFLIPEGMEGKALKVVADKIIDEIVEKTICGKGSGDSK